MYADNIEQGLQVCRLLKEIEPKEVYTVVSSADLSLNLEHVKDYSWKYKIEFNYRYGKDYVYCNEYREDEQFVQPLNSNGKPLCTIAKTNIIAIKEYK